MVWDFNSVIAGLYGAAVDGRKWPEALAELRDRTNSVAVHLYYWNKADQRVDFSQQCADMDAGMVQLYNQHYAAIDRRRNIADSLAVGSVFACHEYFDGDFVRRCPVYQELLIPMGLRYSLASRVAETAEYVGYLDINRPASGCPWTAEEQEAIAALTYHLSKACTVHRRLNDIDFRQSAWRGTIDALPFAMILVDGESRVVDLSRSGEEILRVGDALTTVSRRISATLPAETRRLTELVRAAAGSGRATPHRRGGAMAVSGRISEKVYTILIAPLTFNHPLALVASRPLALIILTDPGRRSDALGRHLMEIYELTATEAKLLIALTSGMPLNEYADTACISKGTARWRLKTVFKKTGAHSQHELTALVLKSLANIAF